MTVRSGEAFELEGASSDIGYGLRRVEVDVPGDDEVSVRWPEFDRIDFSSAPVGVRARSSRLYGTVEDEEGRRFEGYVAWDLDEILESDVLDGEEMQGGRDHEIPFARIASIVKIRRGARVVLKDGRTLDLTGTNDVDDDIRGVQVADPELGLVDLEWEAFRSVEFAPLPPAVGYEDFDGGRPLVGTVTTQSGEDLAGSIRWDADEGASWEFLNGWSDGVEFTIELRHVDRIERGEAFGAHVTLVDERSFVLDDSNDVNWDNKGILVAPESADLDDASAWRLVSWDEFKQVELR